MVLNLLLHLHDAKFLLHIYKQIAANNFRQLLQNGMKPLPLVSVELLRGREYWQVSWMEIMRTIVTKIALI